MTQDDVLIALARADEFVSGEEISQRIGVTRAAVHLAVDRLREEGYEIASVTRRGYRLLGGPDRLGPGDLAAFLPKERLSTVLTLSSVDSTNRRLRELAESGAPEGFVVLSDSQTNGRGRYGRTFVSPAGNGLYLSMLLCASGSANALTDVTAYAAVATAKAVEKVTGICPDIKWVNDLQLHGKKICGILTELSLKAESAEVQSCILGIGINVRGEDAFPPELSGIAGTLEGELPGTRVRRARLAGALIEELDVLRGFFADAPGALPENGGTTLSKERQSYPGMDRQPVPEKSAVRLSEKRRAYLEMYRHLCVTKGPVLLRDARGERKAEAVGIGDDFSLLVRFEDGTTASVRSGEVQARRLSC